MKKEIILLLGKSGAGKDYFVSTFNLKQIITNTTRPKRPYEIHGVHKYFHNEVIDLKSKNVVASTKRGDYYYWATVLDLYGGDVYIIDFPGVKTLLKNKTANTHFTFKIVYIDCPLWKRIRNMLKRKEPLKSICNRLLIDHKDFKGIEKYNPVVVKV